MSFGSGLSQCLARKRRTLPRTALDAVQLCHSALVRRRECSSSPLLAVMFPLLLLPLQRLVEVTWSVPETLVAIAGSSPGGIQKTTPWFLLSFPWMGTLGQNHGILPWRAPAKPRQSAATHLHIQQPHVVTVHHGKRDVLRRWPSPWRTNC